MQLTTFRKKNALAANAEATTQATVMAFHASCFVRVAIARSGYTTAKYLSTDITIKRATEAYKFRRLDILIFNYKKLKLCKTL